MGKASGTMMVSQTQQSLTTPTPKKKRGRPSLSDLHNRALLLQNQSSSSNPQIPNPHFPQNPNHLPRKARSSRRSTPNLPPDFVDGSDYDEDDDVDDDDDDRVQKKVKLVGRLPPNSTSFRSDVVNAVSEDEKGSKGTDTHTQNGTRMLDAGPTTAATTTRLPGNKKLLLLILDKLQKKDTRGVFAEPVDPEELPDYHEVIEHPMDFGTVRKKLDGGLYTTLEQLEADIYLICSNAMEYNAPSTIYFRQARSIQELAKKEFEALRQDGGNNEPPTKPRRGRPPGSRNMKKLLESPLDRGAGESSSDATPVSRDDDAVRSNSYNLRKGPSLYRFPRNLESSFDFTASASKSMPMKYGDKQYASEESKREPYNPFEECGSGQDPSLSSIFRAFDKKLISVGLDFEHSYARSLAKFARDLGPVVWRIVSKKLRSVLPPGVEFGPGWVGENKTSTTQLSPLPEKSVQSDSVSQDSFRSESQHYPSTSSFVNSALANKSSSHCNEKLVEVSRDLNSKSDWSQLKGTNGVMGAGTSFQQIQQGPFVHPGMNGLNRPFGAGFHFQEGIAMPKALPFNPSQSQALKSHPFESSSFEACRSLGSSRMTLLPIDFDCALRAENDNLGMHGVPYWQNVSIQERWDLPYQAEQNTGFQASDSRSSSLPGGSPPPLDLVLQL